MTPEEESDLVGKRIGHYRIDERIGRGGMGVVYRGHDEHLDRAVAVKAIRGDLVADPQARRRFHDEARVASKFVHPYVATVFDVVEQDAQSYLVMEYIEGQELGKLLRKEPVPVPRLTRWFLEIAEGLAAIHGSGLIHRDLKPGNVMIGKEGHAKVMDLGLSEMSPLDQQTLDVSLTALPTVSTEHSLRGTLPYMSPEQLRVEPLDQRSDLFSLGVVLYEAITGLHPFKRGGSMAETISAILSQPPGCGLRPPSLEEAGALGRVALKLLEKDPNDRYARTADLVQDLQALVEGSQPSVPFHAPEPSRRPTVVMGLGLTLLLAFVVAVTWWIARPGPRAGGTRPAVAVLPLQDFTGDPAARVQRAMIADVLATELGESRSVRSVPPHRVQEIYDAAPESGTVSSLLEAIFGGVEAQWVLAGKLYREGGTYLCTLVLYARGGESSETFSVRDPRATTVARLAAIRVEELIAGPAQAGLKDAEMPFLTSESDEAQRLFQRAQELDRELRYAEAIDLLERAVVLDPRFIRASLLLTDLLQRVGFERRARQQIEPALRVLADAGLAETSRLAREVRAMRSRVHGRSDDAIEAYRALADRFPDEPGTLLKLSEALNEGNDLEESVQVIDAALVLDRLDPRSHLAKAGALARLRRTDAAEPALAEAEKIFEMLGIPGGRSSVAMTRGTLHRWSGNYAAASSSYRRAAELFRDEGLPIQAMQATTGEANMELLQWHLDAAEARFRQALPVAREAGHYRLVVRVLSSLGAQLLRQRRLDEAESALRQSLDEAIKLENEALQMTPRINLASVLNLTRRQDEARRQAAEAVALAEGRNDARRAFLARLQIAEADRREGRGNDAARVLVSLAGDAALSADLRAYAWQGLVDVHEDRESPREALEAASEAVRLTREIDNEARLGFSLLLRARVLADLGATERAAADLAEAEPLLATASPAPKLSETARLSQIALAEAGAGRGPAGGGDPGLEPSEMVSERAELLLRRAGIALRQDRLDAAERAARDAGEDRGATARQRVAADLIRARVAAAGGRPDAARALAAGALERAEAFDMPLSTARAAAVLYSTHGKSLNSGDFRDKAHGALQRYLARVPGEHMAWVRHRPDVRDVTEAIGSDG